MLPPIPAWEHVHPIVVHLPLGVLAAVPVLVAIAMCAGKSRQVFGVAALVTLVIGMAGVMLALATGEAAEDAVTIPARAVKVLEHHEDLAKVSRNIFLALTMGYCAIVGVGAIMKERFKRPIWIVVHALFLALLAGGLISLANTGHEGGRLVHEFGVRAHIIGTPPAGAESSKTDQD